MAPNPASAHNPEAAKLPHPTLEGMNPAEALALIRSPNVGAITFFHLLRRFGSPAEALRNLPQLAKRGGGAVTPCTVSQAEKEIVATEKFGARLVMYGEADYPALLAQIADP